VIPGPAVTAKLIPLLATPPTDTTTLPVVAPCGTTATMEVGLQFKKYVVGVPLNVTVPALEREPKFEPDIVTGVPTGPDVEDRLVKLGAEPTVNQTKFS